MLENEGKMVETELTSGRQVNVFLLSQSIRKYNIKCSSSNNISININKLVGKRKVKTENRAGTGKYLYFPMQMSRYKVST